MEQRTLDLINNNILYNRLTELEFLLLTEDLQEKYIVHLVDNGLSTPNWLYTSCNANLKSIVLDYKIKSGYPHSFSKQELSDCSKEQIAFYVNYLIKSGQWISEYEIIYLTDEQRTKYLNERAISGEYLATDLFMMLDEFHKIKYITMSGLLNVEPGIYEWYEVYDKANNRDNQINSILDES